MFELFAQKRNTVIQVSLTIRGCCAPRKLGPADIKTHILGLYSICDFTLFSSPRIVKTAKNEGRLSLFPF